VATSERPDTAQRILDVAEELVQVRGFNAFSYADVAAALDMTKAGLHYHFPGKAALGAALIARYTTRFAEALAAIDADVAAAPAKLDAYASLYAGVVRERRMCLCGMLAAEYDTLPHGLRGSVLRFFDDNETWLSRTLDQGRREGTLRFEGPARETARMIVGGLEGAMLVARLYEDPVRFEHSAAAVLTTLRAG
jgi:TetR/AcrR family transcriptional regulator, transcriptional repressor for nem operon